jgi:hypothetical protein
MPNARATAHMLYLSSASHMMIAQAIFMLNLPGDHITQYV